KYCEFGNLPEEDIGVDAFILDPDNPRIIQIPPPNEVPSISLNIEGDINDLKNCSATVTLRNDFFSSSLQAQNELTGVKLENFLCTLISTNFYKISLDYFKLSEEKKDALVYSANADLSKFIISSTTSKYIPKIPFLVIDNDLLERTEDPYPLYLPYRKRMTFTLNLGVDKYEVNDEQFKIGEDQSGTFTASLKKDNKQKIEIKYEIKQLSKYLDRDAKVRFLEFCSGYLKSKKEMFILSGSRP
ncbi:MAG: hypothetical protein P8Y60_19975, partial [Calditrichota bacterium]